jgi:outer membrane protein TolC
VARTALLAMPVGAQENPGNAARHMTPAKAVQLALKHNPLVKIAGYSLEESQDAQDVARSSFYPKLRNDSNYLPVTDTQFIAIAKGSVANVGRTPVPEQTALINQCGLHLITSGTQ